MPRPARAKDIVDISVSEDTIPETEMRRVWPDMRQASARPVVQFLERLQETGGLKGTDIANFAGVSKATVSRWGSGQKSPQPRTQLIMSDLSYVVMRLGEYYGHEEVRAWLYSRHPQLDGERAIDVIHDQRTEDVIAILDRLDADAYL